MPSFDPHQYLSEQGGGSTQPAPTSAPPQGGGFDPNSYVESQPAPPSPIEQAAVGNLKPHERQTLMDWIVNGNCKNCIEPTTAAQLLAAPAAIGAIPGVAAGIAKGIKFGAGAVAGFTAARKLLK